MKNRSRRRFIQGAAAAASGYWVSGQPTRARAAGPNEKLDVAVIGVAQRGANNLDAMSGQNVVAICDVNEKALGKASEKQPRAQRFFDFRKLLEKTKLDAVVVSAPDHIHAVAAVMAMNLGRHVYCEKPLARSIREARVMKEVASKTKVVTQMGTQHHSGGGYRRAVEVIRSGAIGKVSEVHAWTDRPTWPQGIDRPGGTWEIPPHIHWDLWLGPAPERPYNPAYIIFKWRAFWDFGTGSLGDMGCHIMDPAVWALELGPPSTIECESPPPNPETAPKWSIIRYQFPANHDRGPVALTWYDGGKLPSPSLFEGAPFVKKKFPPDNGSLFVGDKGKLLCPHGGPLTLLPTSKFEGFQGPEPFLRVSPGHHEEWIAACKTGSPTGSPFAYASAFTETVLLGNLAHRLGGRIEWDSEAMKVKGRPEADVLIAPPFRAGWTL